MPSPQQLAANRANSQLSTGPRTPEGKQQSSANSLKHGLSAASTANFAPELRARYLEFRNALEAELDPRSANEQTCFEQYAFAQFMYLQAQSLEANALDALQADPNNPQLEARFTRATRYVKAKVSAARAALKQLQIFQANRLTAAELEERIRAEHNRDIRIPVATPFHLLLTAKDQKTTASAATLRIIREHQNEANLAATGAAQ